MRVCTQEEEEWDCIYILEEAGSMANFEHAAAAVLPKELFVYIFPLPLPSPLARARPPAHIQRRTSGMNSVACRLVGRGRGGPDRVSEPELA